MKKRSMKSHNCWEKVNVDTIHERCLVRWHFVHMLESECWNQYAQKSSKNSDFFSHRCISSWYWWMEYNFFQIILRCRKKDMKMWRPRVLSPSSKITHLIISWLDCTNRFSRKNHPDVFVVYKLLVRFTFWIFYKCSFKSHLVA